MYFNNELWTIKVSYENRSDLDPLIAHAFIQKMDKHLYMYQHTLYGESQSFITHDKTHGSFMKNQS